MSFLTYKYRIKSGSGRLDKMAIACNQVWNFCVATQREAERRWRGGSNSPWPSEFDFIRLTMACSAELGLHSDIVQTICRQFAKSRRQRKGSPRFRASFGARRSLGWVPFVARMVRIDDDVVVCMKRRYRFWKSREIEGQFKSGAFVQDARGRWYVTFQCEVADDLVADNGSVGIDLGLKELATTSAGDVIPALRHYRQYEQQLATAQRAGNKKRVRAIHAKIANARRHHLHEQSTRIARGNQLIAVGNVSASKLAKTTMAKSVLDASWATFRNMLRYKSARRQAVYLDVDERWSSQVCSACGTMPASRPRGIADLGIREWECTDCGTLHNRDVNAARNILATALEHQRRVGETANQSGSGRVKKGNSDDR